MRTFRADLHIHTVLSPCGDLEMSPRNIIAKAKDRDLDIIAITDHNSTLHGPVIRRLAEPLGIKVFFGAEVTTREEVHCLCLFDTEQQRIEFQSYLEANLPNIQNNKHYFGYQVVVNEHDEIIDEVNTLLISGLKVGINGVEEKVHDLGGLFIPAHVDRAMCSLISQLGFIPIDLRFDALEIFRNTDTEDFLLIHNYLKHVSLIKNSDAHFLNQIGFACTEYRMEKPCLDDMRKAFAGIEGRAIVGHKLFMQET